MILQDVLSLDHPPEHVWQGQLYTALFEVARSDGVELLVGNDFIPLGNFSRMMCGFITLALSRS